MKPALILILLSVLGFSKTIAQCVDLKFSKFHGLHQAIPDNLFSHLENEQAKKVTWYWDEENQKSGEFKLYPFLKVDSNEYLINVSTYPTAEGHNYLLLANTENEVVFRDTIGPFLDSFPDEVAVGNITSNETNEILIKVRSELEEELLIYSRTSKSILASFQSSTSNSIFVQDIDSNGQCEIILKRVGLDDDLLPNVGLDNNPAFTVIYSWSGDMFEVDNKRFKSFLENQIPEYESALSVLENSPIDTTNTFFEFDESLKAQLVDTLKSWIYQIENY